MVDKELKNNATYSKLVAQCVEPAQCSNFNCSGEFEILSLYLLIKLPNGNSVYIKNKEVKYDK